MIANLISESCKIETNVEWWQGTKIKDFGRMKITVKARKPYDFDLSCRVFSEGDPQIRTYEKKKFWQILRVNNKLTYVGITSSGTVEEPELSIEIKTEDGISGEDTELIRTIISTIFNLDFDLTAFYEGVKNDETMVTLTQHLPGLKNPTTPTVFKALVDSIIEQQISLKAAHHIERKIIKTFGSSATIGNHGYYAFPTPEQLNSAPVDQVRECGVSYRKAEYIKGISERIVEGTLDLESLRGYENTDQIIDELCTIRGIGKWTAELTAIRGLNRLELFPADDIGIRRVIAHYYCNDEKISGDSAREIAEKWGKWKGLASFYLIIAEMQDITI
jgi:DNA-3-methyladenine glycosylase II